MKPMTPRPLTDAERARFQSRLSDLRADARRRFDELDQALEAGSAELPALLVRSAAWLGWDNHSRSGLLRTLARTHLPADQFIAHAGERFWVQWEARPHTGHPRDGYTWGCSVWQADEFDQAWEIRITLAGGRYDRQQQATSIRRHERGHDAARPYQYGEHPRAGEQQYAPLAAVAYPLLALLITEAVAAGPRPVDRGEGEADALTPPEE